MQNTELLVRLVANDLVDQADDMTDVLHSMVDMIRRAKTVEQWPNTMPPIEQLESGLRAQGLGLKTVGSWLMQLGRKHGGKYHNRGVEAFETLVTLQEMSGFDLGLTEDDML